MLSSLRLPSHAATDDNAAIKTATSKSPRWPLRAQAGTDHPADGRADRQLDRTRRQIPASADQRPDGSWGSPENTKGLNIYAPPPGAHDAFRAAVTSLVIMALIEAEPRLAEVERPAIDKAIDRGAELAGQAAGPAAACHARCALQRVGPRLCDSGARDDCTTARRQAKMPSESWKEHAAAQADMLERYSFVGGGWSYYDFLAGTQTPGDAAFSFYTATVLIALKEAETIGVDFPERLTKKAIASILRQQKPDFSYAYGEYTAARCRMYDINRPGGSLGRSQVCNLALRMYGDERITDDVLKTWLNRLFARNGWLSIGRKRPVPHESHFSVAGYFYYYGHWYAALCIEQLPESERPYFQDHLAHILLAAPGTRRQLVGLSVLQLPPAIRHGDGRDVAASLPASGASDQDYRRRGRRLSAVELDDPCTPQRNAHKCKRCLDATRSVASQPDVAT